LKKLINPAQQTNIVGASRNNKQSSSNPAIRNVVR
jgi:hypothetical protein